MDERRSGGASWYLALAAVISVALVAFWVVPVVRHPRPRAVGDGVHVETYGFDLGTCLVPRDLLVAGGIPKDGLPALDRPAVLAAGDVEAFNAAERKEHRGAYLFPSDVVIGVALGGEARAYPVRTMNWHEVANDTLGGREIAVTWSPLGAAAIVLDRRVAGEVLAFGVPGLLFDSNTLLYDSRAGAGESLWAPLQARAIAGPAAARGARLDVIPSQLTTWASWLQHHPDSTVLRPDPRWSKRYREDPYSAYFGSDTLRFPVRPLPDASSRLRLKARCAVIETGGERVVVPLDANLGREAASERTLTLGGRTVRVRSEGSPPSAFVSAEDGTPLPVHASACWFAWHAMHPDDRVLGP